MNDVGRPSEPGRAGESAIRALSATLNASHRGYEQARHLTADRFLRIEFAELADRRAKMARDLDALLPAGADQKPAAPLSTVHRVFLDLRGNLFRQGRARVLREVVRNEASLEDAFDEVLEADLPAASRALLHRQHRQVRATRDRYAAMLDEETELPPSSLQDHGWLASFNRMTQPVTSNPILSAIVVTAVSVLTARLLRGRRY
jgi:uncharacterized protein (TIGR02284 family)